MALILDASIALAWCFDNEVDAASELVLARVEVESAIVPPLWPIEVANILALAERKGRLTTAKVTLFLKLITKLEIIVDESANMPTLASILEIARVTGLTTYDACYLELAARLNLPLATKDKELALVAKKAGILLV